MIYTNERLKTLRKELHLTQQAFADRIKAGRNTIARYELGDRTPSDAVIYSICKEFGVNETWLRSGEGDMFVSDTSEKLDALAAAHGLGREQRVLLERFIVLKPEAQKAVLDFIMDVAESLKESQEEPDPSEMSAEDLHAELDRHIALEKEAAEKSGVS